MVLAFFLGPVQAASRSLMARLTPEATRPQLFGLYSLAGRATGPLGPALVGWSVAVTERQRAGAAVIAGLTITGLVLLLRVREPSEKVGADGAGKVGDA
jgi:UMF1 family MFS transporter